MKYPIIQAELTGARIQRTCKFQGRTVPEIQQYLGLSCPQSIYRWFKGKSLPSLDHMYALAELLGLEMDQLIVGTRLQAGQRLVWYCLLIGLRENQICSGEMKEVSNKTNEKTENQTGFKQEDREVVWLSDWTTNPMTKKEICDMI